MLIGHAGPSASLRLFFTRHCDRGRRPRWQSSFSTVHLSTVLLSQAKGLQPLATSSKIRIITNQLTTGACNGAADNLVISE